MMKLYSYTWGGHEYHGLLPDDVAEQVKANCDLCSLGGGE